MIIKLLLGFIILIFFGILSIFIYPKFNTITLEETTELFNSCQVKSIFIPHNGSTSLKLSNGGSKYIKEKVDLYQLSPLIGNSKQKCNIEIEVSIE